MENTKKNIVLKFGGLTIAAMLLLMAISFTFVSVFLPKFVADVSYDLGFKSIALYYYEQNYERSKDINDLYGVVTLSISLFDHDKVVKYYEELELNKKYDEFISFINENNKNLNAGIILKSKLINEDNSLKNSYVNSLIETNNVEKAFLYASENFENYNSYSLTSQGVYAFSQFFTNQTFTNNIVLNGLEKNYMASEKFLINHIEIYFNNIYNELLQLNDSASQQEHVNYIALQQRANLVASDLNYYILAKETTTLSLTTQELEHKIFEINKRVKEIIFNS